MEPFQSRKIVIFFPHTSLLHKAEQIVQELLPLWVTVQFIELHKEKQTKKVKKHSV